MVMPSLGDVWMSRTPFDEPSLDEMLSDPIVRLVMRRDGIDAAEVLKTMEGVWRRLKLSRTGGAAADACDGILPAGI